MKKILLSNIVLLFTFIATAQDSLTVDVTSAGGLSSAIIAAGGNADSITWLKVTGNIDSRDIDYMNYSMPVLADLDLGGVTIFSHGGNVANKMPDYCFSSKTSLKSIKLPLNLTIIGNNAFSNCSGLTCSLYIPGSVTYIGDAAFSTCYGLTGDLVIPGSVTHVGNNAFISCNGFTGNLTIPNSVTFLGRYAFYLCSGLSGNLIIPNSLTSIGESTFDGCSGFTGNLIIPSSVTSIEGYAFIGCTGFTGSLNIPGSVTSLEDHAFYGCTGLTEVMIPASVNNIGDFAFYKDSNLQKITVAKVIPINIGANTFGLVDTVTCELIVPAGSKTMYDTTAYWKAFINSTELIYVFFNSEGGSSIETLTLLHDTTISEPVPPVKTGYTFGGWYKEDSYINAWNFSNDTIKTTTTLYAKWNPNIYTVSFNSNGGSVVPDILANYNSTITAPTPPVKTGYTFNGWYKDDGCNYPWVFATNKVISDTVLYAKWSINSYTVSFDSDDGSDVPPVVTLYNTKISEPTAPTKTGYTFSGWYKEFSHTNEWIFAIDTVISDTTLYAKWTINIYAVSFDSNGGSTVADILANYNTTITEPAAPTKTGYTFSGWYTEPALTNAWDFSSDRVTSNRILYAKWIINTYTVKFNSNGGSSIGNIVTNYNTTISEPASPSKTGYTFAGWYKEPALTNIWVFATDKVTSNITLYAKWNINVYTVSFNTNGGSTIPDTNANYNSTIVAPAPPVKTGYTFAGWYKESSCTNAWNFSTDRVTANTTLYAKWTINIYTVSFNTDGGSSVSDILADYNTTITAPASPTKTGYTFAGWYKESSCINAWNFSLDKVIANTTLYAKWNINVYTVSFNTRGGNAISDIMANYNSTISAPANPTKTGYTFAGWYKDSTCNLPWNFSTDRILSDTILFAKWNVNVYTISFDSQGGSIVPDTSANYYSTISAPVPPIMTGYTFDGWYKEAACINQWIFSTDRVISNITLYAKWSINKYTVSFNTNGGTAIASVLVNYRSTTVPPVPPVKSGFTFDGWYIEAACINSWDFDTGEITKDTVLFAKWKFINSYTVSFNTNGGSIIEDTIINENTTVIEPLTPVKPGFTFGGWYRDTSFMNLWDFINDVITSDTTLYAKWTINIYTVSFNTNGGSIVPDTIAMYNTTISSPIQPVRSGYTFLGWYKEASFLNVWNFDVDRITVNTTLYAKWNNLSSINEETFPHFRLYPNPAVQYINLEGSNMQQLIIYNILGRIEITLELNMKNSAIIDVSRLKPGKYLLYIKTRDLKISILNLIKD